MVEQRSPKPSVACSTRVSPAKSKHFVLAFCFKKRGAQVSTQSICSQMQLRLTLHFISLFRREAPYASRLSAKSKHFVLAFCFKKRGAQVSTQSICKQMQPG